MGRWVGVFILLVSAAPRAFAQCPPSGDGGLWSDLSAAVRADTRTWSIGQPLSTARNAHRTNTVEEFRDAKDSDANWFEGDVRAEIDHPDRLEMRHDKNREHGDNLTLREWLERGKATGRGLKIDVKEAHLMDQLLDTIEDVGIPDHRLMLNLGDGEMAKHGAEIRRRFPNAILAINPTKALGDKTNEDGPLQSWQVDRMLALADRFGGPVTFVIHEGDLTPGAVRRLQERGPVSVWGTIRDARERREAVRDMGVEGMIDIADFGIDDILDGGFDKARTWLDEKLPF